MEELLWIGSAVAVVLVLAAAVIGWWQHRTRLNDLQRRLQWSEQSRFALERHAQEVDLRLAAMAQTLQSLQSLQSLQTLQAAEPPEGHRPPPVLPPGDASERRRFMEEALGRADAAAAATLAHASPWKDTEPLPLGDPTYAPTMPLELRDEIRSFAQHGAGQARHQAKRPIKQ